MTLRDDLTRSLEETPVTMHAIAQQCQRAVESDKRTKKVIRFAKDIIMFAERGDELGVRRSLERAACAFFGITPE